MGNSNEWADKLAEGDRVVYANQARHYISFVQRTTKTLIILKNGLKFRKSDLREVGGSNWSYTVLEEATEELVLTINTDKEKSMVLRQIKKIGITERLTLGSLKLILKIIHDSGKS